MEKPDFESQMNESMSDAVSEAKRGEKKPIPNNEHGDSKSVPNKELLERDANQVPKELWPYRDEMNRWVATHTGDLQSFLEYKGRPHKLVCGMGFFHRPSDNVVSLSVPFFKECREGRGMTIDQIFFAALHEFAHLKSMMELDLAGMENMMAQFNYESGKCIRDKENPAKYVAIGSTYRHFYNILEDGLVNKMVERTAHFGEEVSEASRARNAEIKQLYTEQFFALYKKAEDGKGGYIENPDTKGDKKFIFVGEGKGEYSLLKKEDYEAGVNYDEVFPKLGRSGQFITHFIKGQMTGIDAFDKKNVFDEVENKEGIVHANEDVSVAFRKPLAEAYKILLGKVANKYKDNPEALKRYNEFMASSTNIPRWTIKNDEAVSAGFDTVHNVFPLKCLSGYHIEEYKEKNEEGIEEKKKRVVCDTNSSITEPLAVLLYKEDVLENVRKSMGLASVREMTFIDLYQEFHKTEKAQGISWTRPMKYGQVERTRIMRKALEPIYTLLCILDDSFDVSLPDSPEEGDGGEGGEGGEDGESKNETWKEGDRVKNDDRESPYYGKKGIIRTVLDRDSDGVPSQVIVEYEEDDQSSMAESAPRVTAKMSGIEDTIDTKNLILLTKKGKDGQSGKKDNDKRRKESEDEEDDKDDGDEKKDEGKDESESEGESDENEKPDESKNGKPKEGKEGKEGKDEPKEAGWKPLKKWLKNMIQAKKVEIAKEKEEKNKKKPEAQRKYSEDMQVARILEEIEQIKKENPSSEKVPEITEEDIREYLALELELSPMLEKMAEQWMEIINNIATKIEIFRDKYFFTGKMDFKKVQRYFPQIEAGLEIDERRVFEQLIERIDAEVRPQMLRICLLVDNSGSMNTKTREVKTSIMLLLGSLRSFRNLFRARMKDILGVGFGNGIDVVCDSEIRMFNDSASLVMPFAHTDLSFLEEAVEEKRLPEIKPMREAINAIIAFKKIKPSGGTYDKESWENIAANRDNESQRRYIKKRLLSDVIFQVSDGEVQGDVNDTRISVDLVKKNGVRVAGFAIGGDAETAAKSLQERLGPNVIKANTPQEIVEQFGTLFRDIVVENVEQPMEEFLEKMEQLIMESE
jgi:hypothetical protein